MILYNNTICEKELIPSYVYMYEEGKYPQIMVGAIATPGSKTNSSNICISLENEESDDYQYSFLIDSSDALEFCDYVMKASKYGDFNSMKIKANMGEGVYSKTDIDISGINNGVILACSMDSIEFTFHITKNKIAEFLDNVNSKIEDAQLVLEANKNLEARMKILKQEMKDNKVKYIQFDLAEDKPKVYGDRCSGKIVKTYALTPYDYNDNPLYTFYRNMYLTGVISIDYRDHKEEFLNCPFVYTDKMAELGKAFLARRQNDLKSFVSNKTKK